MNARSLRFDVGRPNPSILQLDVSLKTPPSYNKVENEIAVNTNYCCARQGDNFMTEKPKSVERKKKHDCVSCPYADEMLTPTGSIPRNI